MCIYLFSKIRPIGLEDTKSSYGKIVLRVYSRTSRAPPAPVYEELLFFSGDEDDDKVDEYDGAGSGDGGNDYDADKVD